MGRVRTAGEATSRPLSPSRLPLRAHFHQKRDVWVRDRGKPLISHAQGAYFKGKKKQPWVCYLCAFPTQSYKDGLSFATPAALLQVAKNEQKTTMSRYVVFVQDVQASCIPNISV